MSTKRLMAICALALAAFAITSGGASGAPQSGGKLKCFSGAPATCSVSGDVARLDVPGASFAGAYYPNSKATGSNVSNASFSFNYNCDNASTCVAGGSPRWSIPISDNGDTKTDAYAFVDANNCGQAGAASGSVDESCPVFYGGALYPDWAAFAGANPTYVIGNAVPFVIADQPFHGQVFAISFTA
jgi:hypothetical protein